MIQSMIPKRSLLIPALLALSVYPCSAQWTKTVDCPANRIYKDVRIDAGRSEYCDHILPGSLHVKDGPSRFWFDPNFEGSSGEYSDGRQVGKWKECNRFNHCEEKNYPVLDPDELQRPGIKSEVPIAYSDSKYVFDFASCRRTQITFSDGGKSSLELNINSGPDGCLYAYATEDEMEHGMERRDLGHHCVVPFQVGKRAFDSLDLMNEMPNVGLPQYCRHDILITGPIGSGVDPHNDTGLAQVFTAKYDTGNSGAGIAQARLHFQRNAASRSNRCVVRYDPASKSLYLLSDQSGKYLGPIAPGGNDSLWNGECLLSGCSNAQLSGTTLTVQFAIRFNSAQFAGKHHMYLELVDTQRNPTPAGDVGEWTVPAEEDKTSGDTWPSDRNCPAATSAPK